MDNIFLALLLVSIVGLVYSFIKKKDKKIKFSFVGAIIVFFILFGMTTPEKATKKETTKNSSSESTTKVSSTKEAVKESSTKESSSSNSSEKKVTKSSKKKATKTKQSTKKKEKTAKSSSNKEKKVEDRSKFYIIDNLVKNSNNIGNDTMTIDDYEGFAVNAFLLEGAIDKFGLPSHVTGSMKGDETMEVTYPSNEDRYSIGLIFEYSPSGFGDWKLKEKYVVKTDGIGFSKYTPPK